MLYSFNNCTVSLAFNYLSDAKALVQWAEVSPRTARRIVQTGRCSPQVLKLMQIYYDGRTLPDKGLWAEWSVVPTGYKPDDFCLSSIHGTVYAETLIHFPADYCELQHRRRVMSGAAQYVLL